MSDGVWGVGGFTRFFEAKRMAVCQVLVRFNYTFLAFPECVAKGSGLILGGGGRALFATRRLSDRNRCQPSATVRRRPQ